MKRLNKFFLVLCIGILSACEKDDDLDIAPPVDLGGETWLNTALDQWLMDSLTIPYNIAVKYRWDPWELSLDKTLTPPDESKIIPAMTALKQVWIDPFNAETGNDEFIKKYSPKQFKLVGSVEYNANGTVLGGRAEGGNNIAFFDVNQNWNRNNVESIKEMINTSHHEFAHSLNFLVLVPPEFIGSSEKLGLNGYTGTWFNISPEEALENGYITPYSMASSNEDFVEMVSGMLMEGRVRFNELVSIANPVAQQALRTKEQFVVTYYREVWNIDFYRLQTTVQNALYNLVPQGTVEDNFGFDKAYTTASINPGNPALLPQPASFLSIFNASKTAVEQVPGFGLTMDSLAIISAVADTSIVRMYIKQGVNTFFADFIYLVSVSSGMYSFTYLDENENAAVIKDAVTPLLNYFSNNQFTTTWYAEPRVSVFPRVKFTPAASPSTYFLALLLR